MQQWCLDRLSHNAHDSQIFVRFALRSTVFKMLHILVLSHWLHPSYIFQSATKYVIFGTITSCIWSCHVSTKISKCHKILNFSQISKIYITLFSPMTTLFIIKFGSDRMRTGGVAFWFFCFFFGPRVPCWRKRKKTRKNLKIGNFEWTKKKRVRKYGREAAAHRCWPGFKEWFPRKVSLRTTDGRATEGRRMPVPQQYRSADKGKQS